MNFERKLLLVGYDTATYVYRIECLFFHSFKKCSTKLVPKIQFFFKKKHLRQKPNRWTHFENRIKKTISVFCKKKKLTSLQRWSRHMCTTNTFWAWRLFSSTKLYNTLWWACIWHSFSVCALCVFCIFIYLIISLCHSLFGRCCFLFASRFVEFICLRHTKHLREFFQYFINSLSHTLRHSHSPSSFCHSMRILPTISMYSRRRLSRCNEWYRN